MASAPQITTALPFVTDIRFRASAVAPTADDPDGGAVIELFFLDDAGNQIARSLCAIHKIEELGRDALSIACAARAADPKVQPITARPQIDRRVMPEWRGGGAA